MSELIDRRLGAATVLFGDNGGKYPDANAVLVEGGEERVLLDTPPGVVTRGAAALDPIDRILLTHCHEDHMAGNFLFPEAPVHLHEEDLPGILSLEAMLDIYGFPEPRRSEFARTLTDTFHFEPRPEARAFADGDVFDLGGARVTVVHTPGHTRGHCSFLVEPDGLFFLADLDLSGFGPYYGDAWSSLQDFRSSLERVREVEARYYLSGHHIGLLEGREAFLARLDRYRNRIDERQAALLEFLAEPRSMDDIVRRRFIYRQHDEGGSIDLIERRSMEQHLEELIAAGRVVEENGRFERIGVVNRS